MIDCGAVRHNKYKDHYCGLPKGHGGPHKAKCHVWGDGAKAPSGGEPFTWGDPAVPYGMKKPLEAPRSGDRTKFGFWMERGIGFKEGKDFDNSVEAYAKLEKY